MIALGTVFALVLALSYLTASNKDRPIWAVLLAFHLVAMLVEVYILAPIESDFLAIWYASFDWMVAIVILRVSRSRLAVFQSFCLMAAWLVNWGLYYDLRQGSNLVYDQYEPYIAAICVAQLIPAWHGFTQAIRRIYREALDRFSFRTPIVLDCMARLEAFS